MEMSTAQQQQQKMQEEAKQAAQKSKEEAKELGKETMDTARRGMEKMKTDKKPIEAAMHVVETAPKPLYMGLAGGSIIASLLLYLFKKKEGALFVGQWAPTFLALGLYHRLIEERDIEAE